MLDYLGSALVISPIFHLSILRYSLKITTSYKWEPEPRSPPGTMRLNFPTKA